MCAQIVAVRPDVVITEKGVSDLAQHYLMKANISAFRRLRKTDNNRVARACGATICSRTDEVQESDVGVGCGLFEVRKIGDEYFAFLEECADPKACADRAAMPGRERASFETTPAKTILHELRLVERIAPAGARSCSAAARRTC